jgi:hypothetical protein
MSNEINTNDAQVQQAVTAALDEQKKKKKKKKLIIIAVIAVVIILIVAVSSASSGSSESNSSSDSGESVSVEATTETPGKIGDYICTVKSAEVCKDWEGNKAVKITYSFTNNASEAQSFEYALEDHVYQDGIELESVWTLENDEDLDTYDSVNIKPGKTKDVVKAYKLRDDTTDLEVEIGKWLSFDDTVITTTVSIK